MPGIYSTLQITHRKQVKHKTATLWELWKTLVHSKHHPRRLFLAPQSFWNALLTFLILKSGNELWTLLRGSTVLLEITPPQSNLVAQKALLKRTDRVCGEGNMEGFTSWFLEDDSWVSTPTWRPAGGRCVVRVSSASDCKGWGPRCSWIKEVKISEWKKKKGQNLRNWDKWPRTHSQ